MTLQDSILKIPKVGPNVAKKLERLGIVTFYDLLYHFPFRYEDSSSSTKISDLVNHVNEIVTIRAKVLKIDLFVTRYGKKLVQAKIYDDSGKLDVLWFNQTYITSYLKNETEALFYGKVTAKGKKITLMGPKYEVISENGSKFLGKISGIYPETSGVTSRWMHDKINYILERLQYSEVLSKIKSAESFHQVSTEDLIFISDTLDDETLKKYNFYDIKTALTKIHNPENFEEIDEAKKRLGFDEILEIQKTVLEAKKLRSKYKSIEIKTNYNLAEKFIKNSAFIPTNAQIRSANEILNDISKSSPMNRLLEGDVGSGKTWVAAAAAIQVLNSGYDVSLLAPTSVLATQHSESLLKTIQSYGFNVELITAGTKKKKLIEESLLPTPTLFVGTHALLHESRTLKNLGLVIVDEQHRFGVKQREFLLELESENVKDGIKTTPHFLSMTATPIPRSMALTVFGDLELSILDELPEGRIKVETFLVNEDKRKSCYQWAKDELRINNENNQMFVICPLIEESDSLQAKSALSEYEKVKTEFKDFKVELLHGRMKEKEKADILERFGRKEFDILVATPVIEVGIDIKDATIILIESAERFGLAQLHQLRGRVGRSNKKSYCTLFTSDGVFPDRLKFFAQNSLGIKLAEFDLERRGPGEVYGTKQSGIPKLKIANIMDVEIVKKARELLENT